MDNERYAQIRGLYIGGNVNKSEVYQLANKFREKKCNTFHSVELSPILVARP